MSKPSLQEMSKPISWKNKKNIYQLSYACPAEPGYTLPLQTVQIQISWLLNFANSVDPDQLASSEAN